MKKDLPEDVHYNYGFDNTKFIRASIDEVKQTVYEAFVLVIIIIFLFLRDWRVTLVPCIVIPVSLIGAFFVMYLAGFSINVLSMLAVVLAVGLVVDDAIVMTENIYVRIEKGMPPKEAGIEGAKEIFFAVISTTITLVAVFFPIVFMDGTTVPRIQYRGLRFGDYLLLRRIDFYADACHQTFNQKGTAELVLSQDRTFLRRDEPGIQPVTGRLPETALDCPALHHRHHPAYRSPLEYYPG